MYPFTSKDSNLIGLHDCRCQRLEYRNHILSFEFKEGFYILSKKEITHSSQARMECHIIDEDIDGISVYIYKKNKFGKVVREDWSNSFIEAINNGTFEFEFIRMYQSYQYVLFKGYVWFDQRPYHMECDIELHTDDIVYRWNE